MESVNRLSEEVARLRDALRHLERRADAALGEFSGDAPDDARTYQHALEQIAEEARMALKA